MSLLALIQYYQGFFSQHTQQSFTTFDVRSCAIGVMAERAAERLWRAERYNDSPTTIAAMCYLCMASGMSGHESLALQLRDDTRDMGV